MGINVDTGGRKIVSAEVGVDPWGKRSKEER